jgi:uncharacterized protein YuzE
MLEELGRRKASAARALKVKEGEVSDSLELREGLIVDLDDKGEVIGIEILNFSKIKSVRKRQ